MKRYSIDSPDQMKAAALLMKRKSDVQRAHTFAVVWSASVRSGKTVPFKVYIDLGRNATLHRMLDGVKIDMGEMLLTGVRSFVTDLKEVPIK